MVSAARMDRDFSYYDDKRQERRHIKTLADCNLTGKMLLAQNYRSVNERYKNEEQTPEYNFEYSLEWSPVEIMKSCQCYEYQACETDDHEETLAIKFSRALCHAQIAKLPGYSKAPWGIEKKKSEAVPLMSLIGQ